MPKDARSRRNQLFLLALIVVGIGVFVLFTNIDRAMLRQTLDETYTYVETRLHLYEVDAANDRIKSLTRLQDKTAALRDEMTIKGDFTPSDLNALCRHPAADRRAGAGRRAAAGNAKHAGRRRHAAVEAAAAKRLYPRDSGLPPKSLHRPHRAGRCAVRFCRPCAH